MNNAHEQFGFDASTWRDIEVVWAFHHMHHEVTGPFDAAVVLGCHDIGVADIAASAYTRGLSPAFVVSGATSPATRDRFAEGEAVAFAARMRVAGVPDEAIVIEPEATNTGANIALSRALLDKGGVAVRRLLLVCTPYMEKRAYATTRAQWPDVEPVCLSTDADLDEYLGLMVARDGMDASEVVDMMVGDLQRLMEYPAHGFQAPVEVDDGVHAAFKRLVDAGFDSKLIGA